MADHYVKLWASIVDSSVWKEPDRHRIVWVTMLTMADRHGFVGASVDGLARRANVPEEDVEAALASFLAPDPRSRNKDDDGRRIRVVPRGWHIINHGYFRDLQDKEELRIYERERKREQRDKAQLSGTPRDMSGTGGDILDKHPIVPGAYADAASASVGERDAKPDPMIGFTDFWSAYDKKVGRLAAEKAWRKLAPSPELHVKIVEAARTVARLKPDKQFRKDPSGWLNGKCWDDEAIDVAPGPKLRPATHIQNMPLGTESCGCSECKAFRQKRQA